MQIQPLTPEQLERAARRLCVIRNLDPDETLSHGAEADRFTGFVPDILLYSPRWRLMIPQIKQQFEIQQVIDLVAKA